MTESTDKPLPDEQQLDEYLKGDSSVSRQYRQLHSAEVPAELDRLVLRNAEDAVKSRSLRRPGWVRWSAPLAVAASAVLALAIVIETGVRDETMVTAPQRVMQERAEPEIETKMAGEESGQGIDSNSAVSSMDGPPPVRLEMPEPPAEKEEMPALPAPPPAAAPAPEAKAKALARQSAAHGAAEAAVREQVTNAAPGENEAFAAEAAREEERSAAQRAMPEQNRAAGARATVDTRAPIPQMSYSRPISADMVTLPPTFANPEAWLQEIRQLRKDDKQEEADREWRRFRTAFPNYQVAETDLAREVKK